MSVALAASIEAIGAATAVALWLSGGDKAATRRRLGRLLPARGAEPASRAGEVSVVVLGAAVAAGIIAATADVALGLFAGSLLALLAMRVRRRRRSLRDSAGRARLRRADGPRPGALPAALDLLAACLSIGASLDRALESVGQAFGGGLGESGGVGELLRGVARRTALGAPPETAWAVALADPYWAPVARTVIRAHHSGASLTDVLTRLADDRRRELRAGADAAAQRAAVRAVLPLGICFLPAFLLVGVVPVVAGFAKSLWG